MHPTRVIDVHQGLTVTTRYVPVGGGGEAMHVTTWSPASMSRQRVLDDLSEEVYRLGVRIEDLRRAWRDVRAAETES